MKEEKDELFVLPLDSFPSRSNSSMSRSSRFYYRRTTAEGVPFQWEMQPGTPKNNPPFTEPLPPPPISPPPALLSLGLPKKPARLQNKPPLFLLLFGPWRKRSKPKNHSCSLDTHDDRSRFGSCGSHCEFLESSCKPKSSSSYFSSSSSSSSSSLSLPASLPPAKSSDHWRLGCGPWRINPIKIAIGRRV